MPAETGTKTPKNCILRVLLIQTRAGGALSIDSIDSGLRRTTVGAAAMLKSLFYHLFPFELIAMDRPKPMRSSA